MRHVRLLAAIVLLAGFTAPAGSEPATKLTVTGKLGHVMAIGGETTGWSIALDPPVKVEGKSLHAIEIQYADRAKLEELADQTVRAKGKITHVKGVETGERVVLEVSSIKKGKETGK